MPAEPSAEHPHHASAERPSVGIPAAQPIVDGPKWVSAPPMAWHEVAPVLADRVEALYGAVLDVRDGTAQPDAVLEHATPHVAEGLLSTFGADLPAGSTISGRPGIHAIITEDWIGQETLFANVCLDNSPLTITAADGSPIDPPRPRSARTVTFATADDFTVTDILMLMDGTDDPCLL